MKIYQFIFTIDYQDESKGSNESISTVLLVFGNNQKEALEKIKFIPNEKNEIWQCTNCLCKFFAYSKSQIVIDKEKHMIEIEEGDEVQKCRSCKKEDASLYNLVDSTNEVKNASLCSICMAGLLVSEEYSVILNEEDLEGIKWSCS